MKTIINFSLIFSFFFLSSLQGVGGGVFAQQQELFDHTWYFEHGELDGMAFTPPPNSSLNGELKIFTTHLYISHSFCEEGGGGNIDDIDNTGFTLDSFDVILIGVCGPPHTDFMDKHYNIYGNPNTSDPSHNPFTYTLQSIDDYQQLTIENGKGDWAVYNSKLLSTSSFTQTSFAIYPNPVKETLFINKNLNEPVQANIYDLRGKLLHSAVIVDSHAQIDVKQLNPGLYFVVFENEAGQRESKKFVKN